VRALLLVRASALGACASAIAACASSADRPAVELAPLSPAARPPEPMAAPAPPESRPAAPERSAPSPSEAEPSRTEIARLALDGRFEEARARIEELLVERHLAEARAGFAAADPARALMSVDRALEIDPHSRAALVLCGHGQLALALAQIAEGRTTGSTSDLLNDAYDKYRAALPGRTAALGASRCAWLLGEGEAAYMHARAARALEAEPLLPGAPRLEPERIEAEAALLSWRQMDGKGALSARRATRGAETRDALARLLGRAPEEPWIYGALAEVEEAAGRNEEALGLLRRGLDRDPTQRALLDRLVALGRAQQGPRLAEELESFRARHPDSAYLSFLAGREAFHALASSAARAERGASATAAELERAQALLERARELDPGLHESCIGYELLCRCAAGWNALEHGELERAQDAFGSMAQLAPRGLEWRLEGVLRSGIDGLDALGRAWSQRYEQSRALAALERAAQVFELLRSEQPEVYFWANNVGFFNRDLGAELGYFAERLCALASAPEAPAAGAPNVLEELRERADLSVPDDAGARRALADQLGQRAREAMERSYAAYLDASRLAPNDVRTINDTALVAIYHLHRDLERAEQMLRQCVELGGQQIEAGELDAKSRYELENAWGDAHQNLGVLECVHRNAPAAALPWFEKAKQIGPDPRPALDEYWLPLCAGAPVAGDYADDIRNWGRPCRSTAPAAERR
jgi:tetratricopeptide (TPR) repeat protein